MAAPDPGPASLLREGLGFLEQPRLLLRAPELARLPRGSGQPVMVLPGFATTDASTLMLQGYLRLLGYAVRGWRMGLNTGRLGALLPRVLRRVARTAELAGGPVRLVGWSLGGVLAREAARERPELVRRVITLGSPIAGPARSPRGDADPCTHHRDLVALGRDRPLAGLRRPAQPRRREPRGRRHAHRARLLAGRVPLDRGAPGPLDQSRATARARLSPSRSAISRLPG